MKYKRKVRALWHRLSANNKTNSILPHLHLFLTGEQTTKPADRSTGRESNKSQAGLVLSRESQEMVKDSFAHTLPGSWASRKGHLANWPCPGFVFVLIANSVLEREFREPKKGPSGVQTPQISIARDLRSSGHSWGHTGL